MSLQSASEKIISALAFGGDYRVNDPERLLIVPRLPVVSLPTKLGRWLSPLVLLVCDYLAIVVGLLSAIWVRNC